MCVAMLAGCGTVAQNADVSTGFSLGQTSVAQIDSVALVETGPVAVSPLQNVGGLSCQNKLWDPAPSEANAQNLMLSEAKERGFNAVHSVKIVNVVEAVALNCWRAIRATGVAFSLDAVAPVAEN